MAAGEGGHRGGGFGHGGLVGVVREGEVFAAGEDVDARAEYGDGHGGAFGVPARLVADRRAPHGHVEGIVAARVVGLVAVLVGQGERLLAAQAGADVGVRAAEVDVPVAQVGVPGGEQGGGELLHLDDVVAGPGFVGRRVDPQRGHVLVEQVLLVEGELVVGAAPRAGGGVSTSSTSVTLRQTVTCTPAIRSTEAATSDQMKVAACPRWVTSYGVIPHTYRRAEPTRGSGRPDRRASALRRTVSPRTAAGAGKPCVMRPSCVGTRPRIPPGVKWM